MKKIKSILFYVYPCLFALLVGCYSGHRVSLEPAVIQNLAGVKKQVVMRNHVKGVARQPLNKPYKLKFDEHIGYFKKLGKEVLIRDYGGYPNSELKCFDPGGNMIWAKSTEGWPTNDITAIYVHEGDNESTVLVLLHGNDSEYIAFLGENGETKKVVLLIGSAKKYYLHIEAFKWSGNDYIVGTGYNDAVIYNFDGKPMASLRTPVITSSAAGLEFARDPQRKYLAIYVVHLASTHSATLFILSEKWEVIYKEVITKRRSLWMGKQKDTDGEHLIVGTLEDPQGKDGALKEVIWRYSLH